MTELARRPDDIPEHIGQQQLAELSGVFAWKRNRSYLFLGFDSQVYPSAVDSESMLSPDAAECFRNGKRAGLDIMQISYQDVTPLSVQFLAGKVNYRSSNRSRNTMDLLQVSALDSSGRSQVVTVSESALLSGIIQSSHHVWENSVRLGDQQRNGEALAMYSVLVESSDDERNAYAFLFAPPIKGVSNEAAYAQFVQEVLKNLIQMEAGRQSDDRKGYIACAKELLERTKVERDEGLFVQLLETLGVLRPIDDTHKHDGFLKSLAINLLTSPVPGQKTDQTLMDSIDVQAKIATMGNNLPALLRMAEAFYDRMQR